MAFPDARFIHARRRYDSMYRSTLRWFQFWAVSVGDRSGPVRTDIVKQMTLHWDQYPVGVFRNHPEVAWTTASLEELRANAEAVLTRIANDLGLEWLEDPEMFKKTLAAIEDDYGSQSAIAAWLRNKRPRLAPLGAK